MRNKGKIRVRFHLGSGKHYKHWKIEYPNGEDVDGFEFDKLQIINNKVISLS